MATTVSPETISHIGNVVQRFRERMIASNRAYLRDVAQVITDRDLIPRHAMRRMLQAFPTIYDQTGGFDTPDVVAEGVPDSALDGVDPPVPDAKREEFLQLLSRRINDGIRGDGEESIALPEEYVALVHHCDAIRDPNLRVINVAGINGTACVFPDAAQESFGLNADIAGAIQLCGFTVSPPNDHGWNFKTAFLVDRSDQMWCGYAYCYHPQQEPEWNWRLFYTTEGQFFVNKVFSSLEDCLDWLSSWYERDINHDLTLANEVVDEPPFLEGVSSGMERETDSIQDEAEDEEMDEDEDDGTEDE